MVSRRTLLKIGAAGIGASLLPAAESASGAPLPTIFDDRRHGPRDLKWLKQALQTAIQFEFSTIPVYLCAAWSIADDADPAKEMILGIAKDEMSHLGHACNMLTAIGGQPDLTSPAVVPIYPGNLPKGFRQDVQVSLRRLTPSALDVFMAIENPRHPTVEGTVLEDTSATWIAEFYEGIRTTFQKLEPALNTERQIDGALGLFAMQSLADVERAIDEIIQQGEGSPEATSAGAVSEGHYYRFAELHHGSRIAQNERQEWGFYGEVVPFPAVWPMADIPPGGYQQQDVEDAAAWDQIVLFDQTYSQMLRSLQAAWTIGGSEPLTAAIEHMRRLDTLGESLMQRPISAENPGLGNYGPCFRVVA